MYHIGVGFEVVRFDMKGLPGPQLVKRATGKFTLTFYCVLTNCFTLKVRGMAQKKIEEEAEKLGIKKKTLRNAKMELGIDSVKRGNQWYWMLSE